MARPPSAPPINSVVTAIIMLTSVAHHHLALPAGS